MFNNWRTPLRVTGVGIVSSALAFGLVLADEPDAATATETSVAAPPAPDPLNDAFAEAAARVKPSVVFVTAERDTRAVRAGRTPRPPQLPPEFREFFDFGPDAPGMGDDTPRREQGAGSGFIVSGDGYIMTNSHVVDGAARVKVRLLDRREFAARIVGTDPSTDVAVLKIDATGLSAATFGDSDASRVGEWVLAVGNPLGDRLTFTVTSGIISAKGRSLDLPNSSARSIQDFLQTDAAINPGNSGGPLVNVRGEVIGMNTAIASPTGSYAGYGFAVPINLARQVMDQLVAHGRVERAALGIHVRDAGANDAEYVGLAEARGVLVQDFSDAASPAQRAGLRAGDVIIGVNGEPVDYVGQLQEAIAFRKPGETVTLQIARKGGARATVRVQLDRVDDAPAPVPTDTADEDHDRGAGIDAIGAHVSPVDSETARELEIPADARGLLVRRVADDGPADGRLAGADEGGSDVIVAVEGVSIRTIGELSAALDRVGDGKVATLSVYDAASKTRRIERVRLAG